MKVLFAAALYDEGNRSYGHSYEYYNLLLPLQRSADEVVAFDFVEEMAARGTVAMNMALVEAVERERPDIVIVAPYTDQLEFASADAIRRTTPCVGYFFDDVWRVEYTRAWAKHVTFITTSDVNGVQRYRDLGVQNVLYSPFGCNTAVFCRREEQQIFDVSFVGRYHPYRAWLLRWLRRAGIEVMVRGTGWGGGRLGQAEMIEIFNRTRVNLNLSNCVAWDVRYLASIDRPFKETLRAWRGALRARREQDMKTREMVKGRHFEIGACGGFQLSFYVEGLERHYRIGDEIAIYASPEDLVSKIQYYLRHDDERRRIAQAGYERTLAEHAMEHRFQALFEAVKTAVGLGLVTGYAGGHTVPLDD